MLTGERQHVGNWPGKTIEKYVGELEYNGERIEVVDLPGTYSLGALSDEEVIAREFIVKEKPNVIVVLVNALEPHHTFYLALQVLELTPRVVIAFNKIDAAEKRGIHINVEKISSRLSVPVLAISALKRRGFRELLETIQNVSSKTFLKTFKLDYGPLERYIRKAIEVLKEKQVLKEYPLRWAVIRLLEGDKVLEERLKQENWETYAFILELRKQIEQELGSSPEVLLISRRYEFIEKLLGDTVRTERLVSYAFEERIDKLILHPFIGPLVSLLIILSGLFAIFTLNTGFPLNIIFSHIGLEDIATILEESSLTSILSNFFSIIGDNVASYLEAIGTPEWFISLIVDGIIGGVGAVLSFFPLILLTFIFFSFLEDTGLMSRIATSLDFVMKKVGLSGKAMMPLLLGFGCNVPAVMGTRILEEENERKLAILLAPIIPCQARLVVLLAIVSAIYSSPLTQTIVVLFVYLTILLVFLLVSSLIRLLVLGKYEPPELVIELPPYHIPSLRVISWYAWNRSKEFLKKAGTIIFLLSIILWFLLNYGPRGYGVPVEESFAALMAKSLLPIGSLIGLRDWVSNLALLSGIAAKEVVLETYVLALGIDDPIEALKASGLTPLSAFILLIVTMIYLPCVATVGVVYEESKSLKLTLILLVYEVAIAFLLGFTLYHVGLLLGFK